MNHGAPQTASANAAAPPQPKPIRFVTNHDGPYAKRRRINSACLTCRKKKTRCSGERPVCGTCTQNKHECAGYGPDPDTHTSNSPTDATRDGRRASQQQQRRPSNAGAVSSPPARKIKQEAASQAPQRPPLPHLSSTGSQDSDSGNRHHRPKHEEGAGTSSSINGPAGSLVHLRLTSTEHHGLTLSTRNRMPYFRYFGPTAIMPGFKQMVVKVRGKQHSTGHTSSDPLESPPGQPASVGQMSPPMNEARTPLEIPVYDMSNMSPSPLITHLCKLFFTHLGCNFPFLQKERFMRDLEEKQVDAILVDAVCALAARFSTHPMLTGSPEPQKDGSNNEASIQPSEYGQAFAQRAKSAIPDTFSCPSVAVVQAALLLAYDEFGASRDSGLWMYLGISIRMAQDLGMQTLEGLRYEGREGPTPKSVKTDPNGGSEAAAKIPEPQRRKSLDPAIEEQRAVERERIDTFWSIFFLDRVISSGTGRPVTLRDRDIEISFPSLDDVDPASGWPLPFPALIRIVHLYGRVTDLLNNIKERAHITEELRKQLDTLEYHLTEIYQGLSPRLHFNAVNFQHYAKINQGTNFLLLHCWFHTLIVLLHQPTLLKTFEGSIAPLSSNSRELSMSSAKTVADILAFTELIDAKTGVGNPFTSQPIYIAACAFLKETALHSASSNPHSRPSTPGSIPDQDPTEVERTFLDHMKFPVDKHLTLTPPNGERAGTAHDHDQKQAAKHTLLASAANQNYQRCYRALKSLETYWAGVKYILTVLDQKAKGVGDPLLYTTEEMESALEAPKPEPAFTSPGWRRKLSWGTYLTAQTFGDVAHAAKVPAAIRNKGTNTPTIPGSPMVHPSQAIGWSLTGTMNSPSTNVAVMYTPEHGLSREGKTSKDGAQPSIASVLSKPPTSGPPSNQTRIKFEPSQTMPLPAAFSMQNHQPFNPTSMPPPNAAFHNVPTSDPVLVSDADLLLNLTHSPFSTGSPNTSRLPTSMPYSPQTQTQNHRSGSTSMPSNQATSNNAQDFSPGSGAFAQFPTQTEGECTDIDMSALASDMMPWDLEYMPHDMMGFYDNGGGGFAGDGGGG
ncbi:fungal-specific transcription factor domain-domain-containing protein [Clohesyomyces aquaticus]|uniref:Fungal-specific transcription factor domain-domain-containing protein n=1 Tax=Clohesyomyces aquaticus TaxID=1231657 RepID=A0A1Y1ZI03_9PLEO|nr:fungal-specific transcription factor domain-domain-containing protein [Clohesyomyces aquaticus]